MRRLRSRLGRVVGAVAALYFLASLALTLFSSALLFRPPRPGYRDGESIIKLRTADGARVSARYLPNPQARYTFLFSHGKGEDLGAIAPFLERLHDWGYAVLAYDYHGYGTSEGNPTEAHAYRDIEAAYDSLTRERGVPPERVLLFGYSLGSGPTVDLATRRPVGGVILDSPYTSAGRVLTRVRVLPFDRFDNLGKMARVSCPLLVIHRRDDRVIPYGQGVRLYQAARGRKQCWWAVRGGHEGVYAEDEKGYQEALDRFVAGLTDSGNGARR